MNPWRRLDLISDLEQLRRDVWTTPGWAVLRALARLGVIHKPDFASQEDADLFEQLSKNEDSVASLERFGPSLLMSMYPEVGGLSVGSMHDMRTATPEEGRALLNHFYETRRM